MNTRGYGGNRLNKKIVVKTDDPAKRKLYLTITGKVISIVDVKPSVVSLSGAPGDFLEALVTITPAENHDLNILEMSQKVNSNITAELMAPEQGKRAWQIKIKSHSDKADDFYEILTLKTDNPMKPRLKVRIYAIYIEEGGSNS